MRLDALSLNPPRPLRSDAREPEGSSIDNDPLRGGTAAEFVDDVDEIDDEELKWDGEEYECVWLFFGEKAAGMGWPVRVHVLRGMEK